ncbi:MAG: hypothetical protein H7319_22585 [Spirosoma sp.]|nr:hypothetical protein [Spirosoma sp.]
MKNCIALIAFICLQLSLLACKEPTPTYPTGTGDARIAGTWQLAERRFQKDSAFSVLSTTPVSRRDSVTIVTSTGQTIRKDTVITRIDTIFIRRDTSFYTTKRYPVGLPQTLTFGTDGLLTASGSEMTYYYPVKAFRVDSLEDETTGVTSLGVSLFLTTNRATVSFRQGVRFGRDTLTLLPRCEQPCYLKFIKVR